MRLYHGVGLDGKNALRFMSLLDVLKRDVILTTTINILPIINCLHKFSLVKSAVFGLELGTDISVKLKNSNIHFLVFNYIQKIILGFCNKRKFQDRIQPIETLVNLRVSA